MTFVQYVLDLMDNDNSTEVRLQLPMWLGQRYGQVPDSLVGASVPSKHTRLRFNIYVQTKGVIGTISSPSHPNIRTQAYQTHHGRPSRHRSIVKFRSDEFLHKDFVLIIQASGLDRPRCFVEIDPRGSGSVAMQLTLIPKFDLPPPPSQEFIFLVDRSGSMSGDRIATAKHALITLLRALPASGTTYNIFSFGSKCDSLWKDISRSYTDASITEAVSRIVDCYIVYST